MNNNQNGFTLIELLLVFVIIGIIAALSVPYLQKAVFRAEGTTAVSVMRTLVIAQTNYLSQNSRFGRLDELNSLQSNNLGNIGNSGKELTRGKFTFEMEPAAPTDAELKDGYKIIGTKTTVVGGDIPYVLIVDQTGNIIENPFGSQN